MQTVVNYAFTYKHGVVTGFVCLPTVLGLCGRNPIRLSTATHEEKKPKNTYFGGVLMEQSSLRGSLSIMDYDCDITLKNCCGIVL